MDFNDKLRDIYYKKSSKYKGIDRLWNYVRGRDGFFGIKYREVKAFVEKQQSYQVTKAFKPPSATRKGVKNSGEDKGNGYTTVRAPKPGTNLQIVSLALPACNREKMLWTVTSFLPKTRP